MSFEKKRKRKKPMLPVTARTPIGTTVVSRAGRDIGRVYTIAGITTDIHGSSFAFLVGGNRSTDHPKRKNVKQLEIHTGAERSQPHTDTEEKTNV